MLLLQAKAGQGKSTIGRAFSAPTFLDLAKAVALYGFDDLSAVHLDDFTAASNNPVHEYGFLSDFEFKPVANKDQLVNAYLEGEVSEGVFNEIRGASMGFTKRGTTLLDSALTLPEAAESFYYFPEEHVAFSCVLGEREVRIIESFLLYSVYSTPIKFRGVNYVTVEGVSAVPYTFTRPDEPLTDSEIKKEYAALFHRVCVVGEQLGGTKPLSPYDLYTVFKTATSEEIDLFITQFMKKQSQLKDSERKAITESELRWLFEYYQSEQFKQASKYRVIESPTGFGLVNGRMVSLSKTPMVLQLAVEGVVLLDSMGPYVASPGESYLRGGLPSDLVKAMYSSTYSRVIGFHASIGDSDPLNFVDLEAATGGRVFTSVSMTDEKLLPKLSCTHRLSGRSLVEIWADFKHLDEGDAMSVVRAYNPFKKEEYWIIRYFLSSKGNTKNHSWQERVFCVSSAEAMKEKFITLLPSLEFSSGEQSINWASIIDYVKMIDERSSKKVKQQKQGV